MAFRMCAHEPNTNRRRHSTFKAAACFVMAVHSIGALKVCEDVNQTNNPGCYGSVLWAMETGIEKNPLWYSSYPILSMYPGSDSKFKAYQWVLSQKVGPGKYDRIGKSDGSGHNCTPPCNLIIPSCYDITENSPGECYPNIVWARTTGLEDHGDWYKPWTDLGLNALSSFGDFQLVLHEKLGVGNGTGWQCPMPCSTTLQTSTTPLSTAPFVYLNITTTDLPSSWWSGLFSDSNWWIWLLCILACLLCVGLAISGCCLFQPQPQYRSLGVNPRDSSMTSSYMESFPPMVATGVPDVALAPNYLGPGQVMSAPVTTCPSCGNHIQMNERFCRKCGTYL